MCFLPSLAGGVAGGSSGRWGGEGPQREALQPEPCSRRHRMAVVGNLSACVWPSICFGSVDNSGGWLLLEQRNPEVYDCS